MQTQCGCAKPGPSVKGLFWNVHNWLVGQIGDWNTLRLKLSCFRVVVGSLSSVSTWSPLQVMTDRSSSDILIPLNPTDAQPGTVVLKTPNFGLDPESCTYKEDRSILKTLPCTGTIILHCLKLTLVPVHISYLVQCSNWCKEVFLPCHVSVMFAWLVLLLTNSCCWLQCRDQLQIRWNLCTFSVGLHLHFHFHFASVSSVEDSAAFPAQCESTGPVGNCESSTSLLTFK